MRGINAVEYIDSAETNRDILQSDIPADLKALVSCLRKLFLQAGVGRIEAAFYRGSIPNDVRLSIPKALQLIQKYGLANKEKRRGRDIWTPDWRSSDRARRIISSPMTSNDKLALEARSR